MTIALYKTIASLGAWIRTQNHKGRHYKSRCYISGQTTGLDIYEAYTNFVRAEAVVKKTYIPVNPMTIHPDNLTWLQYMVLDVWELLFCKTIYLQRNWRRSKGAKIERLISVITKKEIIYEKQ